ncbi:MAG: hypothetical protein IJT32_02490, partial [Lachnospiraceae bacterium]|nr:hypothetical protein [Lachnospiraceae bacterium]
ISDGTVTAAGTRMVGINCKVKIAIPGTGWENADGTGEGTAIPVETGEGKRYEYQKLYFTNPTYSVTLTGGANATPSGGATKQEGLTDEMAAVTYTANDGYHFAEFSDIEQNGITVKRTGDTTVTVSGKPSANASITVPDAVAKESSTPEGDKKGDETPKEEKKSDADYKESASVPDVKGASFSENTDDVLTEFAKELGKTGDDFVKLVVEPKPETAVETGVKQNIESKMNSHFTATYTNVSAETLKRDFLDMTVFHWSGAVQGSAINAADIKKPIEIAVSYELAGKFNPVVIREHDKSVDVFSLLSARPTVSFTDKTFYADKVNNKVYIYAQKFSVYSIAYSTTELTPKPTASYSGSSSSGGSNGVMSAGGIVSGGNMTSTGISTVPQAISLSDTDKTLPAGVKMKSYGISSGADYDKAMTALAGILNGSGKYAVIGLDLFDAADVQIHQLNGKVAISMPQPFAPAAGNTIAVYRIEDNGTATRLDAQLSNGGLSFLTDHFSIYAFVEESASAAGTPAANGKANPNNGVNAANPKSNIGAADGDSPKTGDVMEQVIFLGEIFFVLGIMFLAFRTLRRVRYFRR